MSKNIINLQHDDMGLLYHPSLAKQEFEIDYELSFHYSDEHKSLSWEMNQPQKDISNYSGCFTVVNDNGVASLKITAEVADDIEIHMINQEHLEALYSEILIKAIFWLNRHRPIGFAIGLFHPVNDNKIPSEIVENVMKVIDVHHDKLNARTLEFITTKVKPTYKDQNLEEHLYDLDNDCFPGIIPTEVEQEFILLQKEMAKHDAGYLRIVFI